MNIAYSFGIIDLFHYGHLRALEKASDSADLHIFGLVSDNAVKQWNGNVISTEEERRKVINSIKCVDLVLMQETLDPTDNLKKIHQLYPKATITLYHGSDWQIVPAEDYINSINGKVVFSEYYEKLSPLNILQALNKRNEDHSGPRNLLSTKASTLSALKERLKLSRIEPLEIVYVKEVQESFEEVYKRIISKFKSCKIVIRSSSKNEDCFETSNAGHYESVLNVDADDRNKVELALKMVIESYSKDGKPEGDEQILVQRQTMDVEFSGVVFTRDIQRNRPYYVINYDDKGSTELVTSGAGGKELWIAHDTDMKDVEDPWATLLKAVREIEKLLSGMQLDIEFAIIKSGEIVIFQVRPLAASYKFDKSLDVNSLLEIKNKEKDYIKFNFSENEVLSDMAFWNPSEIIGDNPKPLDYSLYREIITRNAWNKGLAEMGYAKVDKDLMYKVGNKPYISTALSFLSLTPDSLDNSIKKKLCAHYAHKLKKDISAHDKIEFEIVSSCYDFETEKEIEKLRDYGFSIGEIDEIKTSLLNLTKENIKGFKKTLEQDMAALNILEERRNQVEKFINENSSIKTIAKGVEDLAEAIKEYGTPQFSRQARLAFISRSLCRTMVSAEYISEEEHDLFLASINTIASDFERDFNLYLTGQISKKDFNLKYGHLRAGTYDIRSPRYDSIDFSAGSLRNKGNSSKLAEVPKAKFEKALKSVDFGVSFDDFIFFLKRSLEQREYFKFVFTKSLSRAIELIAKIGEMCRIEREELSYLDYQAVISAKQYENAEECAEFLNIIIAGKKEKYDKQSKLVLPATIQNENDLDCIKIESARPNFITEKTVNGRVVKLDFEKDANLSGKIVVIEKADPGYDWIFTKGISALITKYGGVASHMAIRCAEFQIPAAIGCGEKIYEYVSKCDALSLDCKQGKITEVKHG